MQRFNALGARLTRDGGLAVALLGAVVVFALWSEPLLRPLAVPALLLAWRWAGREVLSFALLAGFTALALVGTATPDLVGFSFAAILCLTLCPVDRTRAAPWSYAGLALVVLAAMPVQGIVATGPVEVGNRIYLYLPLGYRVLMLAAIVLSVVLLARRPPMKTMTATGTGAGTLTLSLWHDTRTLAGLVLMPFAIFLMFERLGSWEVARGGGTVIWLVLRAGQIGMAALAVGGMAVALRRLWSRSLLEVTASGRVRVLRDALNPAADPDPRAYAVAKVEILHDPDPYTFANPAASRSGSVLLAGGSGPEGAALIGASAAMAAMEGAGKAARGTLVALQHALSNYQKAANGWFVLLHLTAEDGTARIVTIARTTRRTAEALEQTLRRRQPG